MIKKTRAIVVYAGMPKEPSGCEIYRGNMPIHFLGEFSKNWGTQWTSLFYVWRDCHQRGMVASDEFVNSADIFIFPRLFISDEESKMMYASLFDLLRANGKRIVYEVDDDFTNEFRQVVDGDAVSAMKWADAITVTTPYLAERMRSITKRPVYVLPNSIDPETWSQGEIVRPPALRGKIIIGLTGSKTHEHDWKVLETVLPKILKDNPNVVLMMMGYHPDYLKDLPKTSYMPVLDYNRYAQAIRLCDIILAPVDPDDRFNLGKSPIKAIEGMAAKRTRDSKSMGAAVIATNNPVYRLAITHEKNGLLTDHTPEAWIAALQRLIDDEQLRLKLQIEAFKWVYKHHNMASEWRRWAQAYQKILAAPANPLPLPYAHIP